MTAPRKQLIAAALALPMALGLTACAKSVSTSSFKGEEHEVAQAISSLQSDVNAADQQKLCANDLAAAVVARLSSARGGCKQVIKNQLGEIDNFDLTVESVTLGGTATQRTATARVKSDYAGKSRTSTLALVREGGKWKIAGLP